MGYSANMLSSQFYIENKNKRAAYEAVKKEYDKEAWMRSCRTIEDVLYSSTYYVSLDSSNNITDIEFWGENTGHEDRIFSLIAPYVKDGSYIKMVGEDGDQWKWVFGNGKCEKVRPTVTW